MATSSCCTSGRSNAGIAIARSRGWSRPPRAMRHRASKSSACTARSSSARWCDSVVAKAAEFGRTYPIMLDNDPSYWRALGQRVLAAWYLIDRTGVVRRSSSAKRTRAMRAGAGARNRRTAGEAAGRGALMPARGHGDSGRRRESILRAGRAGPDPPPFLARLARASPAGSGRLLRFLCACPSPYS